MQLTPQARAELRWIFTKELGEEITSQFTDEMLDEVGFCLLTVIATSLKRKNREELQTTNQNSVVGATD
jgi:hypothetical protein